MIDVTMMARTSIYRFKNLSLKGPRSISWSGAIQYLSKGIASQFAELLLS